MPNFSATFNAYPAPLLTLNKQSFRLHESFSSKVCEFYHIFRFLFAFYMIKFTYFLRHLEIRGGGDKLEGKFQRRKKKMEWYRNDKARVAEALRRGERPDLATTMASGPLDELVALHEELGIFAIVEQLEVQRKRAGVPDALLLRTLATLPFVEQASLSGAAEVLFREPAVLLQLGWAPVQIRSGSNGRHRHPEGRQEESLPCHPDTLRDATLACRGVSVAARTSRRGAVALSAAVGAWQGL